MLVDEYCEHSIPREDTCKKCLGTEKPRYKKPYKFTVQEQQKIVENLRATQAEIQCNLNDAEKLLSSLKKEIQNAN
jgi:hypothetical protein